VIDAHLGPVVLELNARPGLAIQVANRAGLLPRLTAVDAAIRDLRDIAANWNDESVRVQAEECRRMLERAFYNAAG
jgi:hypothetical protein